MPSVYDVAAYILEKSDRITAMKLQKLVYYAQAWSLVWDERPLFPERIEAWANGPVCPDLYKVHRGMFDVSPGDIEGGDPNVLAAPEQETVDAVLKYYGDKSSQWLSELTHEEAPWKDARNGMKPGERGDVEILPADMAEYYGSL